MIHHYSELTNIMRSNKKQNILEANRRLEERYLSEKLTDEQELDYLLEEVKRDFINGVNGNKLNEAGLSLAISAALSGGKFLDLLSSGLKRLTDWAINKGLISKDGKAFNKSEKAQNWLKEKGEKWSERIKGFFKFVARAVINAFMGDTAKSEEITDKIANVLFYTTLGVVGYTSLGSLFDYAGVKGILTAVKGYELGVAVFGVLLWLTHQEIKKHGLRDTVHTLEQCVEGQAGKLAKDKKYREKMTECTLKNLASGHH